MYSYRTIDASVCLRMGWRAANLVISVAGVLTQLYEYNPHKAADLYGSVTCTWSVTHKAEPTSDQKYFGKFYNS